MSDAHSISPDPATIAPVGADIIAAIKAAGVRHVMSVPDIVTSNGAGTNTSSTPSAVVLALFAFLTSWVVARYAFRQPK